MTGRRLKHYEVEGVLGKGGMGEVYRARDTRLDRQVALKVLPPEFFAQPDRRQRFLREAKAACAVNHPAVAQVYDVDEAEGVAFIAMELVEGRTVRQLIEDRELDVLGAIEVATQVADGMAKAHEAGIVHRDLKAENIMVTRDGHAKVLDFGLAKLMHPLGESSGDGNPSLLETVAKTQAGMVVGTVAYMSPEQARGYQVDHRTDIFSMGVVLYEMVSGQRPFAGDTALDTLHAIAFEETRPVTTLRANLPPALQRVLSRCLRKKADDRYGDARELSDDLRTVRREIESGVSTPVPAADRFRDGVRSLGTPTARRVWIPLAGAGIVSLVSAVFFVIVSGEFFSPWWIIVAVIAIFTFRRLRHRRRHQLKKLTGKVRRMKEVRIVASPEQRVIVVVDEALARTYVRINALVDRLNGRNVLGEPLAVDVLDELSSEEEAELIMGRGVLYVRSDILESRVSARAGARAGG